MFLKISTSILFLCILISCKKINPKDLNQVWVEESYENKILTYKSQPNFVENKAGTIFRENGVFTSKQIIGSCATMPVEYKIESGTWKFVSDSVIDVKHTYWGGKAHSVIKIIELNPEELKIKFLVSER